MTHRLFAHRWTLLLAIGVAACQKSEAGSRSHDQPVATATSGGALATPAANDTLTDRADRGRIMGSDSAKIWMIEASDFQCPYCKMWHDESFAPIVRDYVKTGKVRLAFLNFPGSMHPNAVPAAEAAMCASAQGKFWPMHDSLFATQPKWADLAQPALGADFDSLAQRLGVTMRAWRVCVRNHAMVPLITETDRTRLAQRGVNSTPTFFIGDTMIIGAQPLADFRSALDAALAKAGQGRKP